MKASVWFFNLYLFMPARDAGEDIFDDPHVLRDVPFDVDSDAGRSIQRQTAE